MELKFEILRGVSWLHVAFNRTAYGIEMYQAAGGCTPSVSF